MIDEIFAMIMKEARARPGKNLVKNIATVCIEVTERIIAAVDGIRQQERREKKNEVKSSDT